MDTEPIVPKKLTKFERTLQKVAPQVILDSVIGGLLTWFEMKREIAMKGYTSLMSAMPSMQKNSEPTFRPPQNRPGIMLVTYGMDIILHPCCIGQ